MIKEVTYYQVICDGCGKDAQEGSDYSAWADRDTARIEPEASDWLTGVGPDDLDLCDRCQGYEDEERECSHDGLRSVGDKAWKCSDCGLNVKPGLRAFIELAALRAEGD